MASTTNVQLSLVMIKADPDSDIVELVHHALQHTDISLDRILALRGDDAQNVLDYMQKKLEATTPYRARMHETDISTYRSRIRILMTRLALASGRLPEALFLQDVQCDSVDPVGQGSFSDIFKGQHQGKCVALKRLRTFHMMNDNKVALFRESLLWRNLEHRHVLPLLGIEHAIFRNRFCMILPWMPHGNINRFIQSLRDTGHPIDALNLQVDKWFEQIAYGLAYLHSEEIVHGDLRGANVLVDDNWEVKLADFGLSLLAEGGGNSSSLRGGGSRWLAPELMIPERYGRTTTRPTYSSDIYSIACVCIELYTGRPPFFDMSEAQTIMSVTSGKKPDRPRFFGGKPIRLPLWTLVAKCWDSNPLTRPNAESLVKRLMSNPSWSTNALSVKHSNSSDQCLFPGCPRASIKHLGTGQYCSILHEASGLSRTGCLRCRERLANNDDLCPVCKDELQKNAPNLLPVPRDHILFESVSNLFQNTWGRSVKVCPIVNSVYKIISQRDILERYETYRASVEERGHFLSLGKRPGNETDGWHGTRRACYLGNDGHREFCALKTCSLCAIVRTSFDIAHGASGLGFGLGWEILGKGIYTSSSSSKSDKYSYNESWNTPLKAMLLNRVVMGKCFVVDKDQSTLKGPPPGYDSTRLSQTATVDDIAVYQNDAINPSFLVMYESDSQFTGGR